MKEYLIYLGFVFFQESLKINLEKVKVLIEWPITKSTFVVHSFHWLDGFIGSP